MKQTKEEKKLYHKEYRKRNLERCRAYGRKWSREHREVCKEVGKRFLRRHPRYYTYNHHKAWRKRNVPKRNENRAKYYKKHRYNIDSRRRWPEREENLLFTFRGTDVMLAKYIHRTIAAVQVRRCLINRRRRKADGQKN